MRTPAAARTYVLLRVAKFLAGAHGWTSSRRRWRADARRVSRSRPAVPSLCGELGGQAQGEGRVVAATRMRLAGKMRRRARGAGPPVATTSGAVRPLRVEARRLMRRRSAAWSAAPAQPGVVLGPGHRGVDGREAGPARAHAARWRAGRTLNWARPAPSAGRALRSAPHAVHSHVIDPSQGISSEVPIVTMLRRTGRRGASMASYASWSTACALSPRWCCGHLHPFAAEPGHLVGVWGTRDLLRATERSSGGRLRER